MKTTIYESHWKQTHVARVEFEPETFRMVSGSNLSMKTRRIRSPLAFRKGKLRDETGTLVVFQ